MNFLQQLKEQAQRAKTQQTSDVQGLERNALATEAACATVWHYISELASHLNVLQPPAANRSLDGKTPWPAMKLVDFRFDNRKKDLRDREVTQHLGMAWRIVPLVPTSERGSVAVNFPPELERIEARLRSGHIKNERLEQRHPVTNKLQSYVYVYDHAGQCGVSFTPLHDEGLMQWRLSAVNGFESQTIHMPVAQVTTERLDDLAKAIVGQPSTWASGA